MNKLDHIQNGDYIEYQSLAKIELLGPVEIADGQIILVPGKKTAKVALQSHRILAVFRAGKEIVRF